MKIFVLSVIFIAIAVGAYVVWFLGDVPGTSVSNESKLETYSEAVSNAKEVVSQVSSGGSQVEVYSGIGVGSNGTVLDLSGRGLTGSLKAEIRLLSKLEELNISDNNFTGLPAEVGQLSELKVLNLSGNPITGLPYEIGNLQKLEILDLRGTNYSKMDLDIIKTKLPKTTTVMID